METATAKVVISAYFSNLGYQVHCKTIRYIPIKGGRNRRDGNIDNLLSFWVGIHVANFRWQVIVFGSGDFGLGGELSKAINNRGKRSIQLMTLSLPGSTAHDLNAHLNGDVSTNLEIGLDLLR